jgi:hypothetical protein
VLGGGGGADDVGDGGGGGTDAGADDEPVLAGAGVPAALGVVAVPVGWGPAP